MKNKEELIQLTEKNIDEEHICCAISDKKCAESYQAKKDWLKKEFKNGYVFRRVAGKYKKNGHGKALLQTAIDDAEQQGKDGLLTVVGTKKFHFMSDTKWLLRQGFEEIERISSGFSLLAMKLNQNAVNPKFNDSVKSGECPDKKGIVVYYSNRCPFAEFHANETLVETANNRNLPLKVIKLKTMKEAQNCPSPATIFSLFLDGKFMTTDLSVCMDTRYDKVVEKLKK